MKIQSTTPLTYNKPGSPKAQETGIVEGYIKNVSMSGDGTELGANYIYTTPPDENGELTVISAGAFIIKNEEIDMLYEAIKNDIPADLGYRDTQLWSYYLAFALRAAETFETDLTTFTVVE